MNRRYWAACTLGLEAVLADELRALGAGEVEAARGGCHFAGDRELGYRCCLWLRSAVRVQEELAQGPVRDRDELYALAGTVDWSRSIAPRQTFAVDASVRDSFANDTRFPALVVKDAVADQFRRHGGRRPDVDRDRPELPIKLLLQRDHAVIYRELGGEPLHKRGYRAILHKSPLNEALAAGLLLAAAWDRRSVLCDPMCGSGTFLIEAALLALDRAPGLRRPFAFENWADTNAPAWRRMRTDAEDRARKGATAALPALLGNDRHPGAIALARKAAAAAGVLEHMRFQQAEVEHFVPQVTPQFVVCNPPYGERLDEGEDPAGSWRALGAFLKRHCAGATAWLLSGNPELTRHLGLRAEQKLPVRNGPIECRWLRYRIDAAAGE